MPIYEYACAPCGTSSDHIRKYEQRDDAPACATCTGPTARVFSKAHCAPDGVYSHAPNIGCPDRFERQRQAIKDGVKMIPRQPDMPREHRDGQLTSRRR